MAGDTWSLDDLTRQQRSLLSEILVAADGSIFFDASERFRLVAARELDKIGLIELDEPRDGHTAEVGISLTPDGEAWLRTLPEDSL